MAGVRGEVGAGVEEEFKDFFLFGVCGNGDKEEWKVSSTFLEFEER